MFLHREGSAVKHYGVKAGPLSLRGYRWTALCGDPHRDPGYDPKGKAGKVGAVLGRQLKRLPDIDPRPELRVCSECLNVVFDLAMHAELEWKRRNRRSRLRLIVNQAKANSGNDASA